MGKSTVIGLLSGTLKPNLGNYENPPEWSEILKYYAGTEMKKHFEMIRDGNLRAAMQLNSVKQRPFENLGRIVAASSTLSLRLERLLSPHTRIKGVTYERISLIGRVRYTLIRRSFLRIPGCICALLLPLHPVVQSCLARILVCLA